MKSYEERTKAVLDKVEQYNNQKTGAVENGGMTLSVRRNKKIILWTAFAAVCVAIIITFNLIMFLPYSVRSFDISEYKDSEYYNLISVINDLTYREPQYKNNFDKLISGFQGFGNKGDAAEMPAEPDSSGSSGNGNYVETTNNQVKNVIEGDILKSSSKYSFYLTCNGSLQLKVYLLNGVGTSLTSSYTISPEKNTIFYNDVYEMYLSDDCNTVTVITECYDKSARQRYTCLIGLDVSDVNNINESARIYVSGLYISSRLTDGTLLLFTNFTINGIPDFSDEAQFIPQTGTLDNLTSLPVGDIIFPSDATSANYTVVCTVDGSSLEIKSNYAFLSYSQNSYVSEQNIFLTRSYNSYDQDEELNYSGYTEISCIAYGNGGLDFVDNVSVAGYVLNQYSMDEYDGILRIVTQVSCWTWENGFYYSGASLYCIDLDSFEICAKLEHFSPDGEQVFSVRFNGTTAYVCTAEVYAYYLCDPVFAIDLSDLENITYKDTGTITGYSLSLMKFKYDTLLGIGYGDWLDELKVELYREADGGVEQVAAYEKLCGFSTNFKAYYIDAENGLVGLSVTDGTQSEFILMLFDGYDINVVETVVFNGVVNNGNTRAFCLDGYIYIFSDGGISVIDWNA